jgi:hypothetical protein
MAGMPPAATISTYFPTYIVVMPFMIITLIVGRGLVIMLAERPKRPLTQLATEFRTSLATPQRVAHALPIVVGMLAFGGTFTVVKASIPSLAPFAWDVRFHELDVLLHGGTAPWVLLQPLLGEPLVTYAVSKAYSFWFSMLGFVWVWQAFSQRDQRLRLQFFVTLTLGWIVLGSIAAMSFSSAGPCYFELVTGLPNPYAPLMAYLREANEIHPMPVLAIQDVLWQNYALRDVVLGAGISAMPSMHVAMAALFAVLCWRIKRWLGIVTTAYAVIVMIGSVHLAWHYAIDGYAGALGMLLIWWVAGRVVGRQRASQPISAVPNSAE